MEFYHHVHPELEEMQVQRQMSPQFFPWQPGGTSNVNQRVSQLEREVETLQRQVNRLDRRISRLENQQNNPGFPGHPPHPGWPGQPRIQGWQNGYNTGQ